MQAEDVTAFQLGVCVRVCVCQGESVCVGKRVCLRMCVRVKTFEIVEMFLLSETEQK